MVARGNAGNASCTRSTAYQSSCSCHVSFGFGLCMHTCAIGRPGLGKLVQYAKKSADGNTDGANWIFPGANVELLRSACKPAKQTSLSVRSPSPAKHLARLFASFCRLDEKPAPELRGRQSS